MVTMTQEQIQEMQETMAQIQAENASLKEKAKAKQRPISFKVSEKGGVSVYGMGRFPTTLYKSQWVRLIEVVKSGKLDEFLAEHASQLTEKA